jgi:hypothetical protein
MVAPPWTKTAKPKPKTSRFFGVSKTWEGRWRTRLPISGKLTCLGTFGFESDAAVCVNYHIAYLGLRRPLNAIPADEMWHDFSRKRKVSLSLAACAHAIASLRLRSLLRKRSEGSDLSKLK